MSERYREKDWRRTNGHHDFATRHSSERSEYDEINATRQNQKRKRNASEERSDLEEESYERKVRRLNKVFSEDRLLHDNNTEELRTGVPTSLFIESHTTPQKLKNRNTNRVSFVTSTPMVVDETRENMDANINFYPRPRPNFRINYEHLTTKLKILCRLMRKIPDTSTVDEINTLLNEEFLQHNLSVENARTFARVQVKDALSAIQDVWLDITSWSAQEWNTDEAKVRAQSQLEACFDVIVNVWHELSSNVLIPEMKSKLWNTIFELDALYNKMLNICYYLHMKSMLTTVGVLNPIMNQSFSNGNNNSTNLHTNTRINETNQETVNNQTTIPLNASIPIESSERTFRVNPRREQRVNNEIENVERLGTPHKFDDTELKIVNTIKSWPNKYDGTQGNLVQCVESWLQRTTNIITPEKVLANIEWLLEGDALAWHKLFGTTIGNWEEYVNKMLSYINRERSQPEIEADFNDSRHNQKQKEDFVTYYTRLKAMSNRLTVPLSEEKLYERVKRGLRAEYFTCRITARDLTDLLAKCADYENNKKHGQEPERALTSESYEWMNNFKRREQNRDSFLNKAYERNSVKPFNRKYSTESRPHFSGERKKFWDRKKDKEREGRRFYQMTDSSGDDEEEETPELSRGHVRALHESDEEYINMREIEMKDYTQKLNMSKRDVERYQSYQRCTNCRYRGHTVDQCPDAKRGIWDEIFHKTTNSPTYNLNKEVDDLCQLFDNMQVNCSQINKIKNEKKEINVSNYTIKEIEQIQWVTLPNLIKRDDGRQLLLKCMILDIESVCLVDTGADISVLGKGAESILEKSNLLPAYREIIVRTAGGERHPGVVKKLAVTYENETKLLQFVYAPTIKIPIALGMNFLNAWGIKLMKMSKRETNLRLLDGYECDMNEIAEEISEEEEQEEIYELTEEEKAKVNEAMNDIKFSEGDSIGLQKIIQHHIDTGDAPPVFSMPYRFNPNVKEKIQAIIDRWLALGVIEPSISEWRLPIVTVVKPDKSLRLCLDARKLNALTKRDLHMPPNVLHKKGNLPQKAKYFLRLDFNEAFLQTELTPESRRKTAFALPGIGEFQFVRMPFGLTNSPATQSRLMERIFENTMTNYVTHYLDDVVIMGNTFDHLVENLKVVSKRLKECGLTVSRKKTSEVLRRVRILGHIIDEKGIHVDTRKTKAIREWIKPATGKEMQRFLGFINWYRRFVKNFASVAAPLYEISKNKVISNEDWTVERTQRFELLKDLMCNTPVLRTPDWSKPMLIQTDASDEGVGAVLTQTDDEGFEYVIEYYSYKFNKAERKYGATEKEMLAVLKAIRKFKYYTDFNELTIVTDHYALKHLLNMKLLNGRLARWILELQPYVNNITHRAGKLMTVADAISRAQYKSEGEREIKLVETADTWYEEFQEEILENPDNYPQYVVDQNRILRKIPWRRNEFEDDYRILPRPEEICFLIKRAHERTCHAGIKGTLYEIKKHYWWPAMINDVRDNLRECTECISIKYPNYNVKVPLGEFRVPRDTMDTLSIDVKGTLPRAERHQYRNIITAIDLLSRYAWAKKVTDCTSGKLVEFIKEIIQKQGKKPKRIYHDNGRAFMAKEFQEFLFQNNIISLPTAIYNPKANPVERFNRSLTEAIRFEIIKDVNHHSVWSTSLAKIVKQLNERVNSVTGYSPYEVHYGRSPNPETNDDPPTNNETHIRIKRKARNRSILRYLQNCKQYNNRALNREFTLGELVMVRVFHLSNTEKNVAGKLYPPYNLARILSKILSHDYKILKTNGESVVVNANHLKKIPNVLIDKLTYLFENFNQE
ncbi:hypothetical protein PVAND_000965 [Polypedilum vanderplanki]|uniref:RNA-directed DNA polymerase n=1 Tax=Polypedilum vanderplanki TaxID=319348 RepID=A0A9J6BLH2_POLVA|nr:hypothetical protein PVAND_000965 [Polypedilum vanderplanki]